MTTREMPSERAVTFVLESARRWSAPGSQVDLDTRLAELGPALAAPGAWGMLLLGAGLDEFTVIPFEPEPETLADVARFYDAWARASETEREPERPAPRREHGRASIAQLHAHERARERGAITGASYAEWDRASPFVAAWWKSDDEDVAVVSRTAGGQHAAAALARVVHEAMGPPTGETLLERAREPIERAHAAALAVLGPAFVAHGAMASVALSADRAAIANVGAVRVYRIADGVCETLTTDDGILWIPHDPPLAITTRSIGIADGFAITTREIERRAGEVLVLATREIADTFSSADLAELTLRARDAAAQCVEAARRDASNVTAACVVVRDRSDQASTNR